MGQEDVKKVLKDSDRWLISNEIAKKAGYSMKSIQSSLRKLVKWGEVKKLPASKVITDPGRLENRSFSGYAYKIKDFKTMDDHNFENKKILLRADLSCDVDNRELKFSNKFKEHAKTIKELLEKNSSIVILANQGAPGKDNYMDLRQHAKFLSNELSVKVNYLDGLTDKKILDKLKDLKPKSVFLLKNVRDIKEEMKDESGKKHAGSELVKKLSPLFDFYINDAFSLTHQGYASMVGFPEVLPNCAGRNLEQEMDALQILTNSFKKPVVYILGGSRVEDEVNLAEYALKNKKVDTILATGLFGQACLLARDVKLGSQESYLNKKNIKISGKLKKLLKEYESQILTPVDLAIRTFGIRENIELNYFPVYQDIFDVGPKTITIYKNVITNARTVLMKGTAGDCSKENFDFGTRELLNTVAESNAFSIIAGNETMSAIRRLEMDESKFSHMSLGGKALIECLSGKKLPGIEALKIR